MTSHESTDGIGDGHTATDWEITGPLTLDLRAERSGNGTGHIYTIDVEATDAGGNTTRHTVSVSVPRQRD